MGLNQFRKKKIISNKDLIEIADFKQSTMYHIEDNYLQNKFFKYLFVLRYRGVDLNAFFDEEIIGEIGNYEEKKESEFLKLMKAAYKNDIVSRKEIMDILDN